MLDSFAQAETALKTLGYVLKEKLQSNSLLQGVIFEHPQEKGQALVYSKTVIGISDYHILFIPNTHVEFDKGSTTFENAVFPTFASTYQKGYDAGYSKGKLIGTSEGFTLGYEDGEKSGKDTLCQVVEKKLDGLKEVDVKGLVNFIKNNR